jgi:selenocysteine lyase/cysteine desulfurase
MEQLFWSMERKLSPFKTNMQELDCDFYVFQDIKYGPTGMGFYMEKNLG